MDDSMYRENADTRKDDHDYDQATDERTFDDALNHLKEADRLMNQAFISTGMHRLKLEHEAHDKIIKAWNTVAYIRENISGRS